MSYLYSVCIPLTERLEKHFLIRGDRVDPVSRVCIFVPSTVTVRVCLCELESVACAPVLCFTRVWMDEEVLEQLILRCPAGFKKKKNRKGVSQLLFHVDSSSPPMFSSAFLALWCGS